MTSTFLIYTFVDSLAYGRFTHERGVRMALFNLGFMTGISIGPLIAGQLIQAYSWRACSYAMAGALAVSLILTFLFMPETAYNRAQTYGTSSSGQLVCKDRWMPVAVLIVIADS